MWRIKDFGRPKGGIDYHEMIGTNAKFTDMQAVIGIEQMKKLPWRVQRKKEMYLRYKDYLSGTKQVKFIETDTDECAPWFIDILVDGDGVRDDLASFLGKKGIGTRPFYPAIHTQPPYSKIKGDFTNSLKVSREGLWLPSSSFITDKDIKFICSVIKEYFLHD
jgi:perosamine synthetase